MSTGGITVIFCNACGAHNAPDARFCQSCGQAMAAIEPLPVTASIAAYATHPYGGFWIILCIGFLMVAFTEKKQGLHDMLAGTLVQKTR